MFQGGQKTTTSSIFLFGALKFQHSVYIGWKILQIYLPTISSVGCSTLKDSTGVTGRSTLLSVPTAVPPPSTLLSVPTTVPPPSFHA